MKKEHVEIVLGSTFIAVCFSMTVLYILEGNEFMTEIIAGVLSALITGIITFILTLKTSKKSQLTENTEEIKTLIRRLGISDEQTLKVMLDRILADIGRNTKGNLTEQHEAMQKEILNSYSDIKSRYEKEDESYRKFTFKQIELKETMDNFSRDYYEHIKNENKLIDDNIKLENENIRLNETVKEFEAKFWLIKERLRETEKKLQETEAENNRLKAVTDIQPGQSSVVNKNNSRKIDEDEISL